MTLEQVRKEKPLIHCMTNVVVTNFTANGLLAMGASPVMAYAKEEVAAMAQAAGALLLNIGTLSEELIESMLIAGRAANKAGVPVILDPVGSGATPFRTEMSLRILNEIDVTILRGNAGEIASLVGIQVDVKGVDGGRIDNSQEIAEQAARKFDCITVVTGRIDVVTNGNDTYTNGHGHMAMTKVVGTGCLLGAVIGAYLAIQPKDRLLATLDAVTYYGIAGEKAFLESEKKGIGTFQEVFLNQLDRLTDSEINELRQDRSVRKES